MTKTPSELSVSLRVDEEASKAFVVKTSVANEKFLAREPLVAVLVEFVQEILHLGVGSVNALPVVVVHSRQIVDRLDQRLQLVLL